MAEEFYFASDTISGIKIDVVISMTGVRKILINRKLSSDNQAGMIQITSNHSKILSVFTQLKEYFNR
jgi:hypothetical protein